MPEARPGGIDLARAAANEALAADPFSGEAYFVRGTVELAAGDASEAVRSLRSALYLDPTFALAAFQLGRAYDALEDRRAARRAYEQALRSFDPYDTRHGELLGHIDRGDVAAACAARLTTLAASSARLC
jgi:tetratricopeptide (TPR) repeat protein